MAATAPEGEHGHMRTLRVRRSDAAMKGLRGWGYQGGRGVHSCLIGPWDKCWEGVGVGRPCAPAPVHAPTHSLAPVHVGPATLTFPLSHPPQIDVTLPCNTSAKVDIAVVRKTVSLGQSFVLSPEEVSVPNPASLGGASDTMRAPCK